jgi:hypothetical protein
LLYLLLACVEPDDQRFPTGGDNSVVENDDTETTTDDTGVTDTAIDPGVPVITDYQVGWCIDAIQGVDDYIAFYLAWEDDSSIEGGRILLDLNNEALIGQDNKEGAEIDSSADPLTAFIVDGGSHDGDVFTTLVLDTQAYGIRMRLRDKTGNMSDAVEFDLPKNEEMPLELCTANSGA